MTVKPSFEENFGGRVFDVKPEAILLRVQSLPLHHETHSSCTSLRRVRDTGRQEECLSLSDDDVSVLPSFNDFEAHVAFHHVEELAGDQCLGGKWCLQDKPPPRCLGDSLPGCLDLRPETLSTAGRDWESLASLQGLHP